MTENREISKPLLIRVYFRFTVFGFFRHYRHIKGGKKMELFKKKGKNETEEQKFERERAKEIARAGLVGRYPFSAWVREKLPRYVLPGGAEIPVGPDPRRTSGGSAIPLMNEREFRDFLDAEIPSQHRLWIECRVCGGSGQDGMEGQLHVCETCRGFGRFLTPRGVHLFEMLAWASDPQPLVKQKELDKQNEKYQIEYQAQEEKIRLIEEAGIKAKNAQQAADAKVTEKINKEYAAALAKLEQEKQEQLKRLGQTKEGI